MTDGAAEPLDDPSYQRFLADCAKDCRCCSRCWDKPCAGCTAGGVCDDICHCDELEDTDDA